MGEQHIASPELLLIIVLLLPWLFVRKTFPGMRRRNFGWQKLLLCHSLHDLSHTKSVEQRTRSFSEHWKLVKVFRLSNRMLRQRYKKGKSLNEFSLPLRIHIQISPLNLERVFFPFIHIFPSPFFLSFIRIIAAFLFCGRSKIIFIYTHTHSARLVAEPERKFIHLLNAALFPLFVLFFFRGGKLFLVPNLLSSICNDEWHFRFINGNAFRYSDASSLTLFLPLDIWQNHIERKVLWNEKRATFCNQISTHW